MGIVMKTNIPAMNHAFLWRLTWQYMERNSQHKGFLFYSITSNYWPLTFAVPICKLEGRLIATLYTERPPVAVSIFSNSHRNKASLQDDAGRPLKLAVSSAIIHRISTHSIHLIQAPPWYNFSFSFNSFPMYMYVVSFTKRYLSLVRTKVRRDSSSYDLNWPS